MCMWPLTKPGVMTMWRPSITRSAVAETSSAALPTRAMRPFSMRTSPSWMIRRWASRVSTYRAWSIFKVCSGMAPMLSFAPWEVTMDRRGFLKLGAVGGGMFAVGALVGPGRHVAAQGGGIPVVDRLVLTNVVDNVYDIF